MHIWVDRVHTNTMGLASMVEINLQTEVIVFSAFLQLILDFDYDRVVWAYKVSLIDCSFKK